MSRKYKSKEKLIPKYPRHGNHNCIFLGTFNDSDYYIWSIKGYKTIPVRRPEENFTIDLKPNKNNYEENKLAKFLWEANEYLIKDGAIDYYYDEQIKIAGRQ